MNKEFNRKYVHQNHIQSLINPDFTYNSTIKYLCIQQISQGTFKVGNTQKNLTIKSTHQYSNLICAFFIICIIQKYFLNKHPYNISQNNHSSVSITDPSCPL